MEIQLNNLFECPACKEQAVNNKEFKDKKEYCWNCWIKEKKKVEMIKIGVKQIILRNFKKTEI